MKTCGIDITVEKVRFIILDDKDDDLEVVQTESKFLTFEDRETPGGLIEFKDILHAFFDHHSLDKIGIIRRTASGRMSAHGDSFKIEALIQLYTACSVDIISSKTVNAFVKKHPHNLTCENKNQQESLLLAYYLIKN